MKGFQLGRDDAEFFFNRRAPFLDVSKRFVQSTFPRRRAQVGVELEHPIRVVDVFSAARESFRGRKICVQYETYSISSWSSSMFADDARSSSTAAFESAVVREDATTSSFDDESDMGVRKTSILFYSS